MASPLLFGIITFLHDLFSIVWLGGLFFIAFVVIPYMNAKSENKQEKVKMFFDLQKKVRPLVLGSIFGIIVTGVMMSTKKSAFFNFSDTYGILLFVKHLSIIIMLGLITYKTVLMMQAKKEGKKPELKMQTMLIQINAILGILVLLMTGLMTAFPKVVPI